MKVSPTTLRTAFKFNINKVTSSSICVSRRHYSTILRGHSLDATTIHTKPLDSHHTFLTGTNSTNHTLIFSRYYADPKDKKKESKEKESKEKAAAPPAEAKDAKKDAKKDEKKGGKKKVDTGPKRLFDLYNLFKDKPMSKTPVDQIPQWFVDMAIQFNAGTLGKEAQVDIQDFKSVKRYLRKIKKKKINDQNKESIVDSGEGEGDYEEEKLPVFPKKPRPVATLQQ